MSVSDAGNVGTIVLDQEPGYEHDTFKNKIYIFMFSPPCIYTLSIVLNVSLGCCCTHLLVSVPGV